MSDTVVTIMTPAAMVGAQRKARGVERSGQQASSARRVLVVDDDPMILEVVRLSLEAIGGWEVITADGGAEALERAAALQPDAIVMDVMMPGMDGPEVSRRLEADPATASIPIILLTAKVQRSEQEQWATLPVRGVLAKPFDPVALPATISELLGWS